MAWLLEHVKPLSDALDWLAGDPDQITAYAQTWRNVAANSTQVAADYQTALATQITDWGGTSAQAYRQHAAAHIEGMQAIGRAAEAIGALVEGAGLLVALVRELVRDLIAEFVATLAVRLPLWTAEVGLTLGIASPYVASQVTALVAKWSARIAKLVSALINGLRRLAPIISRLDDIINEITDLLRRLARSDSTGGGGSGPASGGTGQGPQLSGGPDGQSAGQSSSTGSGPSAASAGDPSGGGGTTPDGGGPTDGAGSGGIGVSRNAGDLIRDGQEFSGRRLPSRGGPPDGVLYKSDPQTGQVTNYTVYDADGNAVRRVDVTGRPHGGVPTPHVVEYERHVNPNTGQVFVREQRHVRPARPDEIP